jgi:hypothetical protein
VDGDDAVSGFELYRYTHADGSAKEWAWREEPGVGMEVRWGRAGSLMQRATYPVGRRRAVMQRALAKQRKGYRYVGRFHIDADGKPVSVATRPNRATTPLPEPAGMPIVPPIDLSQVETGREDYWF